LGRLALAKFMAVPHYVYLLLMMPGNTGVLSLRGDLLKSFEYFKETIDHASTIRVPSSVSEILAAAKELTQQGLDALKEAKLVIGKTSRRHGHQDHSATRGR